MVALRLDSNSRPIPGLENTGYTPDMFVWSSHRQSKAYHQQRLKHNGQSKETQDEEEVQATQDEVEVQETQDEEEVQETQDEVEVQETQDEEEVQETQDEEEVQETQDEEEVQETQDEEEVQETQDEEEVQETQDEEEVQETQDEEEVQATQDEEEVQETQDEEEVQETQDEEEVQETQDEEEVQETQDEEEVQETQDEEVVSSCESFSRSPETIDEPMDSAKEPTPEKENIKTALSKATELGQKAPKVPMATRSSTSQSPDPNHTTTLEDQPLTGWTSTYRNVYSILRIRTPYLTMLKSAVVFFEVQY
ncbi:hypothetical protein BSL78_15329 [Apostichopus japonicus]|uniref:Uncharacterized protein n=1 Tax=Stichopus japonicus TaxID=307972 RepID=A0A2G8KIH0_STIJA|nr:hypothetical protein BSL78_15329 [Apostichopus japonicus]